MAHYPKPHPETGSKSQEHTGAPPSSVRECACGVRAPLAHDANPVASRHGAPSARASLLHGAGSDTQAVIPATTRAVSVSPPQRRGGGLWRRGSARLQATARRLQGERSSEKDRKRCLRCGSLYLDKDNSPTACAFHGHVTGEKGLFSPSPPHQGIDGEWSDRSGVIVYRWNDKGSRPNTGRANWKGRWSCCQERDEGASPCRRGCHLSYDDGFTLF